MVCVLPPWHENRSKRRIKAPKVYLRDSGLLHALLESATARHLNGHPKVGRHGRASSSKSIIAQLGVRADQCYFWSTHAGAELDLLVMTAESDWASRQNERSNNRSFFPVGLRLGWVQETPSHLVAVFQHRNDDDGSSACDWAISAVEKPDRWRRSYSSSSRPRRSKWAALSTGRWSRRRALGCA
jgi:hypothetical protein